MALISMCTAEQGCQTRLSQSPNVRRIFGIPVLLSLLFLCGCASKPPSSSELGNQSQLEIDRVNDPWESANRKFFAFGITLDRTVGQPLARGYRRALAPELRTAIRNVVHNLREPVTFGNDVLQADFGKAGVALGRLVINSTMGMGGLFDPAQEFGLPRHQEDFGQTLAVWGVGEGPYFFVPVLGPYPPRDLTGFAVDIVMNPLFWG